MKRAFALLPLLALAACADEPVVPPGPLPTAADAAGAYIVVMKDASEGGPRLSASVAVADLAGDADVAPERTFTAGLHGFAADLTAEQVAALRADPRVAYVEPDRPAQLFTTQFGATWGIDRIDQGDLPLSGTFSYTNTGKGVRAYVLDTGIRRTHRLLYPRVQYLPNGANGDFVGDGWGSAEDCHGHGTHVAGTIGSTTYGVAKGVSLVAARVVDCVGNGTASMAIAAMEWIIRYGTRPAVVNMSLGYGDVQSVRDMADRLVVAGYFVAAAAGNGNYLGVPENACLQSPAGAKYPVTVGATTSTDAESSFSNYGTCVDILAPGSSVTSTDDASDVATVVRSGTSMATPHVAGVAAQWLETHPLDSPFTVTSAILGISVTGTITLHGASALNGTPNRFPRTAY